MSLPCGTPNYTYSQDMAIVRTRLQWVIFVIFLVFLATLPLYTDSRFLSRANWVGIALIAAIGLNILTGYCGQLSIGHAGFIAVGAYTSAILTGKVGVPFPIALLCSGLTAGLIGVLFGVPSLRVKGFYLAISTIAAQFIIIWVLSHWSSLTGGFMGMKVPYASVGGYQFASESSQFYLIFGVAALCTFFAVNLARTRVGRAFVAIRDNDLAAQVMGINIFHYKLLAFFLGCFFAGISGCLLAHWIGTISTDNFTLTESVKYVGVIIIGGLGSSIGPILGVLLIWPGLLDYGVTWLTPALQSTFSSLPSGFTTGIGPILFGLVIILFLVFEPRGMAHRWSLFKSAYRLWPFSY
jgi:branched-chain amino acid transport system permease protein